MAGSCQTLEVLPGFHFGGSAIHLHSLECAAVVFVTAGLLWVSCQGSVLVPGQFPPPCAVTPVCPPEPSPAEGLVTLLCPVLLLPGCAAAIPMCWLCPSPLETPQGTSPGLWGTDHRVPAPSPPSLLGECKASELLCPHSPMENPHPCAQEGRDLGCGLCQDTGASQHQHCHGLLWQRVGSGHPKTDQVSRQNQVGPPSPGGTKEYLFIPSGAAPSGEAPVQAWLGRFWLRGACGEGELRHSRGTLSPCGSLVSLLCIVWGCSGEPGQSCPHGTLPALPCSLSWLLAPLGAEG